MAEKKKTEIGGYQGGTCGAGKLLLRLIFIFFISLGMLVCLLYLTSFIPKDSIRENLLVSAEYLLGHEDEFYCYIKDDYRTQIDNYADTILFNIMYSLDEENRFVGLVKSMFYSDNANPEYPMIELLRETILEGKEADTVYDRYWHGMQVLLRPLFVVFDITQIRWLVLAVLLFLLFLLSYCLWKKQEKIFAVSLWAGAVLVGLPMAAFCVEYVDTWLIMLVIALLCVKFYAKTEDVLSLMLISGVCCGFFDFLTTEMLAVVLPLAVVLCLREKEGVLGNFRQGFGFAAASGSCWGIGYALTLISKWALSSIITQSNRFTAALTMAAYRIGADVTSNVQHTYSQPVEALAQNLRLLTGFPADIEHAAALMIVCGVCAVLGCFVFLYRKSGRECLLPLLLLLLAFVPVLRIMVLSSHSYQHCFFTYRALFGTVCCIIVAVGKVIDWNLLRGK